MDLKKPVTTVALATLLLSLASASLVFTDAAHAGDSKKKTKAEKSTDKIFRVEGEVTKPTRLEGPAPQYTEEARKKLVQGAVVAQILIEKDGSVSDVEIQKTPSESLNASTIEALQAWTFEPATLKEKPVRVHFTITVNYQLDSDG